jgi:2-amino-4-hydroxy-6-hydroxymethyldihydropteridine diphosphokinase
LSIAFIALGSNKGNIFDNLKNAVRCFENDAKTAVVKKSSIYETKPFGYREQGNFLNAVIKINTNYLLKDLFNFIKEIEKKLGRTESFRWGPREIDIDILLYDDLVYSDELITIPHPGIPERDFVLVPLNEIEPGFVHPVLKKKISDICSELKNRTVIKKLRVKL